jgi:hypothetical protein
MPTNRQLKRLFALARKAGISPDEVKTLVADRYGHASRRDLSDREYEELCLHLQETSGARSRAGGRRQPGELADQMEILAFLREEGLPWDTTVLTDSDITVALAILDDFRCYRQSYKRLSVAQVRSCLRGWGRYPVWVWRRSADVWLTHYRTLNERYFAGILQHVLADARRAA